MISSSRSRRAPIPVSLSTARQTRPRSASDLPERGQPTAGHPQAGPAGPGTVAGLVVIAFLLAMLAAPSQAADPAPPGPVGPDDADLRYVFDCSELARMRSLSFDEAAGCTRAFLRIKLSFVPGIDLGAYDRLPPSERAAVNLLGYRRYVEWRREHAAEVEAPRSAPPSSSRFAAN